eukprot:TRINITY_DN94523_c0_g1_i1.p1 TRINITY_DN94523_c0_g1~~TRINITY_DN94523_c0_g1_i1.p1  ORF type:complete len:203 (+),score=52.53 TRINITY_DN94523_c0_g1_i1:91-699(+)
MVRCFSARSIVALLLPITAQCDFRVKFDVETVAGPGSFTVKVHEDWAPNGAAHFKDLVEKKFYDNTRFFRVIPDFMVQFGISGDPTTSATVGKQNIPDDPVVKSNLPGYITYAMTSQPNSRSTQLFINYVDNSRLDAMGFAPFGQVEGDGMQVVKSIYDCEELPQQGMIQAQGNQYLDSQFPQLSKIVSATILDAEGANKEI